jgi:hypothetical protein
VREGADLCLRDPIHVGDNVDLVGILHIGDIIRVVRCSKTLASSTGGTYLDAVVVKGELLGKTVSGLNSIGSKSVTSYSGVSFSEPDSDWFERISYSQTN